MSESLCDRCRDPGACCRDFPLSHWFDKHRPIEDQWRELRQRQEDWNGETYPFVPVRIDPRFYDPKKVIWRFRCEALGADGRCTIYDKRPVGPCRVYQPAEDQMCAMYASPEGLLKRYKQNKEMRKELAKNE